MLELMEYCKKCEQVNKLKSTVKELRKENRKLKKEMTEMLKYAWYKEDDQAEIKPTKTLSDIWLEQEEECEKRTLEHLNTLVDKYNKS